jgi:hypothetical protein
MCPRHISSIPNDPDFIAIVKMQAVVEPILNDLIASRPPRGAQRGPMMTIPDEAASDIFKRFMYYRLADYLSEALQTPPPPPEGGLLGMLGTPPPKIEK